MSVCQGLMIILNISLPLQGQETFQLSQAVHLAGGLLRHPAAGDGR